MHEIIPIIEKMDTADKKRTYVCYLEDEKDQFVAQYPTDQPVLGERIMRIAQRKLDANHNSTFVLKLQGYFPSILPVIALLMLHYPKRFCLKFDTKKFDQRWDGIISTNFKHDPKTRTQTTKFLQRLYTLQTQDTITELDKRTLLEKAKRICTKQMYRISKRLQNKASDILEQTLMTIFSPVGETFKKFMEHRDTAQKTTMEEKTKPSPPESVLLKNKL